jgi:hypothetical protein
MRGIDITPTHQSKAVRYGLDTETALAPWTQRAAVRVRLGVFTAMEALQMATSRRTRKPDGGRQRCVDCGHPRKEHRGPVGCTVPRCSCAEYKLPDTEASSPT